VSFSPLAAVCEEAPAYQISATELTGAAGSGSFSGKGINSAGLFTPAKAGPGTHTIMNRYVTTSGCADTQYHEIIVHPQPIVNAGDDILVLKGTSTLLKATASGNDLKVLWSPATYLNNPSIINPKSTPLNETLYTLTAVSSEGCTNKDEVLVEIVDKLYIPNAFTPNGDGVNDGWFVPYFNSLTDIDVKIFNRYGQLVFHTSKENKPWDGKVKGIRQPSGAYVYIVESKENNIKATGTLVLIQ
jgi:gliding motility-associated-like protein